MGCMHTPRKAIAHSALPYHQNVPVRTWLKLTAEDVK